MVPYLDQFFLLLTYITKIAFSSFAHIRITGALGDAHTVCVPKTYQSAMSVELKKGH